MTCNKITYESKNDAKSDVRLNDLGYRFKKHLHGDGSNKLRPYLCPLCNKWHLTKLPKKVQKSRYGK